MTDEERRAWMRTLAVLLVVAGLRWTWSHRPTSDSGPGIERDVSAAVDTVRALRSEEERRSRALGAGETIDPNRADEIELDRLPGVGPATAAAIVSARGDEPFFTVDDLLAVRGIGPATLEKLRPHLRIPPGAPRPAPRRGAGAVSGRSVSGITPRVPDAGTPDQPPVEINSADAALLETLPGIGPALAARIMRDRAGSGRYTRVDDLLRVSGIGPVTLDRLRPFITIR